MKKLILLGLALVVLTCTPLAASASMGKDNPEKKAIVLAIFGTTYPTAVQSMVNLKTRVEKEFPSIPVHVALTSKIIRNKWAKRAKDDQWRKDHPEIPNFLYNSKNCLATIADLQDQGYNSIAVQSTHIFAGEEYQNLKNTIEALDGITALRDRDKPFKKIFLGRPALGEPGDVHHYTKDIARAAQVLKIDVETAKKNKSALVYMGHGNEIFSTGAYVELEAALRDANPGTPVFVGNVEGFPGPARVLKGLKHAKVEKITLFPLMVVAGDHASNDMAGDEEDSWKTLFESNKMAVTPVLRGLGQVEEWADIYVTHLKEAMELNRF